MNKPRLTIDEAAELYGVSARTLRLAVTKKKLKAAGEVVNESGKSSLTFTRRALHEWRPEPAAV